MAAPPGLLAAAAAGLCLLALAAVGRRITHSLAAPDSSEEQQCLEFLQQHMPERDRGGRVSNQLLREHVRLALAARRANTWAAAVPWELFLNDVLPYRNLDEPLDNVDWRPMFHERFMPLVASANSLTEAAQLLNRDIWAIWGLHFVPDQSPEIMSPGQTLAAGYASCTGLSIFLADACRAVGIPARVAGTPSWVKDRRENKAERFNNHNWVEVWDGTWSFTGACEYNQQGLNRTWFFPEPAKSQLPGSFWHAIYAASYRPTGRPFPLAWAEHDKGVPGVDVTQAYRDAQVLPAAAAAAAAAGTAAAGVAAGAGAADARQQQPQASAAASAETRLAAAAADAVGVE